MSDEARAEQFVLKYGFDLTTIDKAEIVALLRDEIKELKEHGSDGHIYLRVLCGYLFCLGDAEDIPLLSSAKYDVSFDAGCMVDGAWIDCLKQDGDRRELIEAFMEETKHYFGMVGETKARPSFFSLFKKGKRHGNHPSPILRGRQPHRRG